MVDDFRGTDSIMSAGTQIAGRYVLQSQERTDLTHAETWLAQDSVLNRKVRIVLLHGPFSAEALDAARRAALISDSHFVRVLDAGSCPGPHSSDGEGAGQDTVRYVVTEAVAGTALTDVVAGDLLDSEQTRAIVGEVASGLDVAAKRGVHHQVLRPDAVVIDTSKAKPRVLIMGLGIHAALTGVGSSTTALSLSDDPDLDDARGLASLAYFCMTAVWPGISLNAPWRNPHAARPLTPVDLEEEDSASPDEDSSTLPSPLLSLEAATGGCDATLARVTNSLLNHDDHAPQSPGEVAEALRPWKEIAVPQALEFPGASASAPVEVAASEPPAITGGLPLRQSIKAGGAANVGGVPVRRPTGRVATGGIPAVRTGVLGPAAGVTKPPTPAWGTPVAAEKTGTGAPAFPRIPVQEPRSHAPAPPPPPARKKWGVNPTPIVLIIMALGLVGGLAWAINQALLPFGPAHTASTAHPSPTDTATDAADPTASPEASPEASPTPEVRPIIQTGTITDGEKAENAYRAVDGDPSTAWTTFTYRTAAFGGLKSGVGYAITVREAAPVHSISLITTGSGGQLEIRNTTANDPQGGTELASGPFDGTTEFTFANPVTTDSLVIWISELPTNDAGRFIVELYEITLQ